MGVSVGYQARLRGGLTIRAVIGSSFLATREVRDQSACQGCLYEEYKGGAVRFAAADLGARLGGAPIEIGIGLGARRYALPTGPAILAFNARRPTWPARPRSSRGRSYDSPLGRGEITMVEFGPYLSRYHGKTMVDFSVSLISGLPIKRLPLERPEKV